MNKLIIILVPLILIVVLGFFMNENEGEKGANILTTWFSEENENDDDDIDSVGAKQQLVDGSLIVRIPVQTQELAGLKVVPAEKTRVQSEDKAFATIIDMQSLLDLRSQYREVQAERDVMNTALRNSGKSLEQLRILHKEASNVSARELQMARSRWEEDRARIRAADVKLANLRDRMIQDWNSVITEWALKDNSELFSRLIEREDYLMLLTLKASQALSEEAAFVFVNRNDNRKHARKSYFISAAPFSDLNLQGETYFFRVNAENLRTGMRLYVWLPDTGFSGEGIYIPEQAVVWYAGKPWAYVQLDDEQFSRRSLIEPIPTQEGWLVEKNFNIDDQIVVSGAQTLLSEEFKWAIPDEDDD